MGALQDNCDRISKAVLWRRSRLLLPLQVYILKVQSPDALEVAYLFLTEDWPGKRCRPCTGNPGFPIEDFFNGDPEGFDIGVEAVVVNCAKLELQQNIKARVFKCQIPAEPDIHTITNTEP